MLKSNIGGALAGVALVSALTGCTQASLTDPTAGGAVGAGTESAQVVTVSADPAVAALVPPKYKDRGTVTVAMDASYPPFQFFANDNKTVIGFDAEFSAAVAQRMGLTAHVVNIGFDTILTGLSAGRYDLGESAFTITPERQRIVDFVSYLQDGAGLAVAPGNPHDLTMDPSVLCGHSIAAQKGTLQAISQLPDISAGCTKAGQPAVDVQLYPSQNNAVLALASGRVEAMMADSSAVAYQGRLAGGKFVLAPGDIYEPDPTGIALPKGSPLKPAVSAAVKSLYADGTVRELAKKWSIPTADLDPTPGS